MLLEVRPQVFDGIEFGRIGGKSLQPQPSVTGGEQVLHRLAAMDGGAVPNDQ